MELVEENTIDELKNFEIIDQKGYFVILDIFKS
jgi:hypothetical protein